MTITHRNSSAYDTHYLKLFDLTLPINITLKKGQMLFSSFFAEQYL
ncbi:MAG: hypothetical protein ACJ06V_11470 [Verrucomicrobiota bacterium]